LTSNQFFVKRIDPGTSRAFLEGDEHHHLARVVRIRAGDEVWLFDEGGRRWLAEVEAISKDETRLRIIREEREKGRGVAITLGQSLIKPKAMDLVVQKASELGAAAIVPLVTARSAPGGRSGESMNKVERWRKIALEAAKQSNRAGAPVIVAPVGLGEFVGRDPDGRRLFLSENGGELLRDVLCPEAGGEVRPGAVTIVIGPEGGWAKGEEETLLQGGFGRISLGRTILRAETAAIAAVAMIAHFWNG
jgi:16S rRNA (uracil1498-N3)-methyltransferase